MILTPKAKPVRIRIKSGGIEHSSLDSLREHFDYEDVFNLCQKGSILRWLEQHNEEQVLQRLKCALAGDTNDEEKYRLNVVLSFFPDASSSGVNDTKDLLLYWAKRQNNSNIFSFLDYVYDKEVLLALLDNIDDDHSNPIRIRLGKLYFDSNDLQKAADLGNADAILALKESLPPIAYNLSPEDIVSFAAIKKNTSMGKSLSSIKATKAGKAYASVIYLIQGITKHSEDITTLIDYLSKDKKVNDEVWPEYILPYITYVMWAVRKYIGKEDLRHWVHRISPTYFKKEDGRFIIGFGTKISQAQDALFQKVIEYSNAKNAPLEGITESSINKLRKINYSNKIAFITAINSIKDEILGI